MKTDKDWCEMLLRHKGLVKDLMGQLLN